MSDLKFAFRQLRKNLGFTTVAVLTLGLGIGTNTALFSFINAFLLRPLAVAEPHRLVGVYNGNKKNPEDWRGFSYASYLDVRNRNEVFADVLAHQTSNAVVSTDDRSHAAYVDLVSANFFSVLGVRVAQGRSFLPEEDRLGAPVAVASYSYWKQIGFPPDLIGSSLRINATPFIIIGIAPEGFTGITAMLCPEMWLPLASYDIVFREDRGGSGPRLADRRHETLRVIARLKPSFTVDSVKPPLRLLSDQLGHAFPEERDRYYTSEKLPRLALNVRPIRDTFGMSTLTTVLILLSGIVLVIVCVNLGNMMLARAESRHREIAVRFALGGTRQRILRQLLMESFLLALSGGGLALLLALWGNSLLLASLKNIAPFFIVVPALPDFRILTATLGFCIASTLLFGLTPARRLLSADIISGLKAETSGHSAASTRAFAPREFLVVGQIALSLMFLTAAGLFLRSTWNAAQGDPGFPLDHGAVVELAPGKAGHNEARGRATLFAVIERLAQLPGITSVALTKSIPFSDESLDARVRRVGAPPASDPTASATGQVVPSCRNVIGTDYFKTRGVPLLRGREFTRAEMETLGTAGVTIIDAELARHLWPGEDALGRRIQIEDPRETDAPGPMAGTLRELEIVGIVPSFKRELYDKKPTPHIYEPFGQRYSSTMLVQVKHTAEGVAAEAALLAAIREAIHATDPQLPVVTVKTLRTHLATNPQLWIARTWMRLFSIFGGLALFLASIGVYGVNAYAVSTRTREMGIRIALGARPSDVRWLILRGSLKLAVTGMGIGLLLAAGIGRLLSSWLYDVSAFDPLIFLSVFAVLGTTTILACWIPANRATSVDPMTAVRTE
jgi:predicted permease